MHPLSTESSSLGSNRGRSLLSIAVKIIAGVLLDLLDEYRDQTGLLPESHLVSGRMEEQ